MTEDLFIRKQGYIIRVTPKLQVSVLRGSEETEVESSKVEGLPSVFSTSFFQRAKLKITKAADSFRIKFISPTRRSIPKQDPLFPALSESLSKGNFGFVISTASSRLSKEPSEANKGFLHLCIGVAFINTGRSKEAIPHLLKVVERSNYVNYEVLTTAYVSLTAALTSSDPEEAEKYAKLALSRGPPVMQICEIYLSLACIFHRTKPKRAVKLAQYVLNTPELPPLFKYLAYVNMSGSYIVLMNYSLAYDYANEASQNLQGNNKAAALANLAAACIGLEEHEEAVKHAQNAIRVDELCDEAYKNLAAALAILSKRSRKYMAMFLEVKEHIKKEVQVFGTLSAKVSLLDKVDNDKAIEFFSTIFPVN